MDRDGKEASAAQPQHTEAAHWVLNIYKKRQPALCIYPFILQRNGRPHVESPAP